MSWLNELKPGDEVIQRSGGWVPCRYIRKVGRVTATQVIIGTQRFRKSDGWEVGRSAFTGGRIEEANDENLKKVRAEQEDRTFRGRVGMCQSFVNDLTEEQQKQFVALVWPWVEASRKENKS